MIEYNSIENYTDMFADILCDAHSDNPDIGNNIVTGFKLAIQQMLTYHKEQVEEYERLAKIVDEEI